MFYPHSSSACLRLFLGSIHHYVCWRKDPHFVDVFFFFRSHFCGLHSQLSFWLYPAISVAYYMLLCYVTLY